MARSFRRLVAAVVAAATVAAAVAACGARNSGGLRETALPTPAPVARTGVPQLRVDVVARGLSMVSDVGFLPDGKILVAQLGGRLSLLSSGQPGAAITPVTADFGDVYVRGEGGLLGLVINPDFGQSRRFTTCQTHADRGTPTDVRLVTWELAADGTSARRVVDPLVGGLPINTTGRHSGCRPAIAGDGALLVGTGDSARAGVPQDLTSLGGKILRVDLTTGAAPLGNPYSADPNPAQQLVLNYGHTNVTGIAMDPNTGNAFSTEVGATDDEVNMVLPGANYGWDPSRGGARVTGYDETVPMTDLTRYPKATPAVWDSKTPVPGLSGAAFIEGRQWGDFDGMLAVTALAGQKLILMTVTLDGRITDTTAPAQLTTAFGKLSGVRLSPSGDLFVMTANGTDDKLVRITPQ